MPTLCAPWPGNKKAIFDMPSAPQLRRRLARGRAGSGFITRFFFSLILGDHLGAELFDDPAVEPVLGHGVGHTDGVLDGAGAGGSVTDDAGATDSQQRTAAKLLVLEPALEFLQAAGNPLPGL